MLHHNVITHGMMGAGALIHTENEHQFLERGEMCSHNRYPLLTKFLMQHLANNCVLVFLS